MIKIRFLKLIFFQLLLFVFPAAYCAAAEDVKAVRVSEGQIEIPTYEFSGRQLQPPLFKNSTIRGKYPFAAFIRPFKPGGPQPVTYRAIFLENEYLKLTYLPEFGGRFFSLYDKITGREMFYRNDVIKPAGYNMKDSFPLFGIELTGPYDTHAITLKGEPLWFNKIVHHQDGSAELVLGTIDPVYRMKVNFSARLYPGLAAMELKVFCYNRNQSRKPYMFWISSSMRAEPKTRFIYPMTRTIGHTTSEVADWPFYNEIDYSWDRNHKHMLGVFGIDIYDDFQGAYDFGGDYGVFRYADRRIVEGMKMWTFGYSERATNLERAYTDNAGPYIEVQSGRHVWDGHYEWLDPYLHEGWSEWWLPVAGIGGFTSTRGEVSLKLEVSADGQGRNSAVDIGLSAVGEFPAAQVNLEARCGEILNETVHLAPGRPFNRKITGIRADSAGLAGMRVTVTGSSGKTLLSYLRPDTDPGRKEYTPFTAHLEKETEPEEQMSAEQLLLAARFELKQFNNSSALRLLNLALARDPGHSQAHLELGIIHLEAGLADSGAAHFESAVERDPYLDEAHYYLALCRLETGDTLRAERQLYYISPGSSFYPAREYLLGRLSFTRGDLPEAIEHLNRAVSANGQHLDALCLLALVGRLEGNTDQAEKMLDRVTELDPTSRRAAAERYYLSGSQNEHREELLRLLGGQSQEAVELSTDYSRLGRWEEAAQILRLVEDKNDDPWGTPPIFYYTLAYCLERSSGEEAAKAEYYRSKARQCRGNVDRFPFRPESAAPLAEAAGVNPEDAVARYELGCLLYHLGRRREAIRSWEEAVKVQPDNPVSNWALGMACADQGLGIDRASQYLERAIELEPENVRLFNDLSDLYARSGRFDEQMTLLKKALVKSPEDDDLVEGLIAVHLVAGNYEDAEKLIYSHKFNPRHRTYHLRDKYRFLRYGLGALAFNRGDFNASVEQFDLAFNPPVSMGMDDFQNQSAPRLDYYRGRVLEALGRKEEAAQAYSQSARGWKLLSQDRDSMNSENFHMALSMERLGLVKEAEGIIGRMENFALSQMEHIFSRYRSEAHYLLALVNKKRGNYERSYRLLEEALEIEPQLLGARFELRKTVIDPLPE